ncbi:MULTISPECIES: PP2C family protein-serine/threonine phosphatase [Prochlorococcus]|uniref:PP2C family protein-serine/threonine phosphatase n=1 Tax=Prochlorococcus TaxID=1218 RepID=UPI001CECEFBD|nr:GAF domain-containing SpoIIE family protein phosphatase [Prochlorococcus marinus]
MPNRNESSQGFPEHELPFESVRELLDSLSTEQSRNQELISSIGFSLRSFTNLDLFLELIPVIASRLVGVKGALLIPFHSDGRISREQLQILPQDNFDVLIRKILDFQQAQSVAFANEGNHIKALDKLIHSHIGQSAIFSTSLVARGKQRGRLYVFDLNRSFSFSNVHRRQLQFIADLAGVAIENHLLLQQTRSHESVDRQLSIGAEIQSQLLPDHCPVIEGIELAACCRPAFQVAGDYYDFMPTRPELMGKSRERGRWALVVGDVMGKGVPAGLLMTMLRGMLRAEVLSGLPPDRILHDLNQLALDDLTQSHRFVTLFYSDYEPKSRRLRFANAAHNPPLLWSAKEKEITRLDALGLLIGLQQEAEYVCGEVTLDAGDVLLYYTDGVTEALGISGERFNEKRLISLLNESARKFTKAKDILDNLFKRLDSFVGDNHHLEDDASMVVLKVDEAVKFPHVNNSTA